GAAFRASTAGAGAGHGIGVIPRNRIPGHRDALCLAAAEQRCAGTVPGGGAALVVISLCACPGAGPGGFCGANALSHCPVVGGPQSVGGISALCLRRHDLETAPARNGACTGSGAGSIMTLSRSFPLAALTALVVPACALWLALPLEGQAGGVVSPFAWRDLLLVHIAAGIPLALALANLL